LTKKPKRQAIAPALELASFNEALADEIIARLNAMLVGVDSVRVALGLLIAARAELPDEAIAHHPTIQVGWIDEDDTKPIEIGFLGMLNGLVGIIEGDDEPRAGAGYISAWQERDGHISQFFNTRRYPPEIDTGLIPRPEKLRQADAMRAPENCARTKNAELAAEIIGRLNALLAADDPGVGIALAVLLSHPAELPSRTLIDHPTIRTVERLAYNPPRLTLGFVGMLNGIVGRPRGDDSAYIKAVHAGPRVIGFK
jgi:hypothetical protein